MTDKISPATVSALSETMLIPLWAKAVEQQRPQPLLKDAEAPRMLAMIDYDFERFKGASLSQPGCCGRAALIDDEVQAFIRQHPDAVVAQIGAGIDARFERLGRPAITAWVDMDLPEVIALRRRLLPASTNIYLEGSLLDEGWTATLAAYGKPVLLVLEGVLMYFDQAQVQAFFAMLARRLPGVTVVFDMLPPFVLKHGKHHDALKRMGAGDRTPQRALWQALSVAAPDDLPDELGAPEHGSAHHPGGSGSHPPLKPSQGRQAFGNACMKAVGPTI